MQYRLRLIFESFLKRPGFFSMSHKKDQLCSEILCSLKQKLTSFLYIHINMNKDMIINLFIFIGMYMKSLLIFVSRFLQDFERN